MNLSMKMFRILAFVSLAYISYTNADIATVGIVHYNDLFGQLQRFKYGVRPPVACSEAEQKCSGGIAELMAHIREVRENDFKNISKNSILTFAAGNLISGENGWIRLLNDTYTTFHPASGWEKYGILLGSEYTGSGQVNYGRPNAMALGPREFDGGLKMVNDYIKGMNNLTAIVSNVNCGLNSGEEKEFCTNSVKNFDIIETAKVKIGVVGFVDTIVIHQSEPGSLEIQDTIISLKKAVSSLLAYDNSVKTIIAIGTGPLNVSKTIIDEIPQIKVVIYGGGKNSDISDEYPLQYNSGYIATAHKYGESLGKLKLQIDETNGNVVSVEGSSRIKNDFTNYVQIDDFMKTKVQNYADFIEKEGRYEPSGLEVLGRTKINLEGSVSSCWGKECPLGDLITDAMVHCALNYEDDMPVEVIALWHSSGISGVLPRDSEITRLDVHKWMAYNNMATLVTMKGNILRQMFNASAQTLVEPSSAPKWGQFLQVSSGVDVSYIYNEVDNQVETSIKIAELNNEGKFAFQEVQDEKSYKVIIPSFLYNGRNVYHFLPKRVGDGIEEDTIEIDMDYKCVENYIKAVGVVSLGYQERMHFIGKYFATTTTKPGYSSTIDINPTTPSYSSTTPESFWESMDNFSKAEVILTTIGITLLIVAVIIAATFAFLIKTNRRPTIIRHKRMYDDSSFQ